MRSMSAWMSIKVWRDSSGRSWRRLYSICMRISDSGVRIWCEASVINLWRLASRWSMRAVCWFRAAIKGRTSLCTPSVSIGRRSEAERATSLLVRRLSGLSP